MFWSEFTTYIYAMTCDKLTMSKHLISRIFLEKMQTKPDISAMSHVTTVQLAVEPHPSFENVHLLVEMMSSKMVPERERDRKHFYHTHCCCYCGIPPSHFTTTTISIFKIHFCFLNKAIPRGFTVIFQWLCLCFQLLKLLLGKNIVQFNFWSSLSNDIRIFL